MALLTTSKVFSQTIILGSNKDTATANICFTLNQSKFLEKSYYKWKECDTLRKVCEQQRNYCDSALQSEKKANTDFSMVIKNNENAFKIYDYAITGWSNKYKASQKEVRKQKVYKWIAIGTTALATTYLGYYVISHPK